MIRVTFYGSLTQELCGSQTVSIVLRKVIRKFASNKNNDITFNTTLPYYGSLIQQFTCLTVSIVS